MHQVDFTNTVATLGTALTAQHIRLLARFTRRIVLLFDGDEAGQRAATRAADLIIVAVSPETGNKADIFVAVLPGTMDPAEFCAAEGAEAMQKVLDAAVPLLRFALDRRLATWDLTQPETRARALDDVVRLLVPVKGTLLAADYLSYLADVFRVDTSTIAAALERAKPLAPLQGEDRPTPSAQSLESAQQHRGLAQMQRQEESALERELLLLYIEQPEVRERLHEAFARIEWQDATNGRLAAILLAADKAASASDLLSAVTAREPEASSVLSAARLSQFDGLPPHRLAGMLMYSLREGQLQRLIRTENAQLRQMSVTSPDYDERYQRIAALQQELSDLKKRAQSAQRVQSEQSPQDI
jgi:DNA primase